MCDNCLEEGFLVDDDADAIAVVLGPHPMFEEILEGSTGLPGRAIALSTLPLASSFFSSSSPNSSSSEASSSFQLPDSSSSS